MTMIIYVDKKEYHCHTKKPDGEHIPIETEFFNGKCAAYIEGFIWLPEGHEVVINGDAYNNPMITPWKDIRILDAYQEQYEAMLAEQKDMQNALNKLGVTLDE